MFLRTILENIENIILLFSKNCFCPLNFVFFMFFKTKKNQEPNVFSLFSLFYLFLRIENSFKKQEPNIPNVFCIFRTNKNWNQTFSLCFPYSPCSLEQKIVNKQALRL